MPHRPPSPERPLAVYLGQDCTDSAVIRRIASFEAAGLRVLGLTFRRRKFNAGFEPDWANVDLGTTVDRNYLARIPRLLGACRRILRARRRLRPAAFFYARNIDQGLLALWARRVAGSRAPVAYEVLDVQRIFTKRGLLPAAFRWVERRLLDRIQLLVVSSPAYVREYFEPVQRYRGEWALLENKICGPQLRRYEPPADRPRRRRHPAVPPEDGRWVVGWFGTLRCPTSLHMLARIAAALPDRVRVELRGLPTETGLDYFLGVVDRRPNMDYRGEYFSPRDLEAIYGGIHLAWCFDFLDAGTNSRWLLPNRLYDAGYHDVPVLAAADTETGARVREHKLGWAIEPPYEENLIRFLRDLTPEAYHERRDAVAGLPRGMFLDDDDTSALVRRLLTPGAGRRTRPTTPAAARRDRRWLPSRESPS